MLVDVKEFERAMDQMSTYLQYADEGYLACLPATAMQYLEDHALTRRVSAGNSRVLDQKLATIGAGLLLVERGDVSVHLLPKPGTVQPSNPSDVVRPLGRK